MGSFDGYQPEGDAPPGSRIVALDQYLRMLSQGIPERVRLVYFQAYRFGQERLCRSRFICWVDMYTAPDSERIFGGYPQRVQKRG